MTQKETKRCLTPFWDCHCHLSFLQLEQVASLIQNSDPNKKWIMGGYQPSEWEHQVELKNKFPDRFLSCFGLHPWYIKSDEFDLTRDYESLKIWSDQADFIGEVGLDFFGEEAQLKKEAQLDLFEKQLELSSGKPFVFHIVQAHGKALDILKDHSVKGFVHSFSGSIEVAEQYMSLGISLSFGPNILNENFKKAQAALVEVPLEFLVIESDSPSHPVDDSDPNEMYLKVVQEVARVKNISVSDLEAQVALNIKKLLA